jgi:hypothetical protein
MQTRDWSRVACRWIACIVERAGERIEQTRLGVALGRFDFDAPDCAGRGRRIKRRTLRPGRAPTADRNLAGTEADGQRVSRRS